MKIVLDARKMGDGGIGIYIQNLVDGLLEIQADGVPVDLSLLVDPSQMDRVEKKTVDGSSADEVLNRLRSWSEQLELIPEASGKYSLSEYFGLARRHRALLKKADIFHSPHYTLPYGLRIPSVITVHDVIHITQPDTFYHAPVARRLIKSAVRRASHVITVSSASLARLTRVVGCPKAPVTVIPNVVRDGIIPVGSEQLSGEISRLGRRKPYALFVGSDRPHKNFHGLLRGWKLLNDALRENDIEQIELVAVGGRYAYRVQAAVREMGLGELVSFVGDVPVADLNFLYHGAHAVIVPSIEEGFGLVALEGLAAGVPVVCTPEISLKEVCENCAWYSEDSSPEALANTMIAVLTQSELAQFRVEEGRERAQLFSRELAARMTYAVYEDVLAGGVLEHVPDDADEIRNQIGGDVYSEYLRRAV